jgi:hypothetical protein
VEHRQLDRLRASIPPQWLVFASGLFGVLAILIGAASWFHPHIDGSDLWWHLASGQYIWEHHAIPLTDPFSHTASGQPWTNHSWLWGWLFWAAYAIDTDLVAWLNLAVLVAVFALVGWHAKRVSHSWLAAGATTWIVAATCHWFLDVRPHITTLLFTALLLATLEWRRAPWLWTPLVALWANLHGGFIFGLGVIGLHTLLASAKALHGRQPLPHAAWIGLACAVLAAGFNPWGYAIYGIPLEHLDRDTPFVMLTEWRASHPNLDPKGYAGRFGWMMILALIGVYRARTAPFSIALALVTAAMALTARRFIPLFAISAAPLVALGLGAVVDRVRRHRPALFAPWPQLAASTAALLIAALLWSDVRFLPRPLQRWTGGEAYPSGAAEYLASMREPPQRLFNFYTWGGYLMLHAPDVRVFIDGRATTLYSKDLAADYFTIIDTHRGWRKKLEEHAVDAVLSPIGSGVAVLLQQRRPPWRVAYRDPRSVLLFPPADPMRPELAPPSELLPDGADLRLSRGYRWMRNGNLDRASTALLAAQRMDPMQLLVYEQLIGLAALRGDAAEVRRWIDEALRVYPRRSDPIWAFAVQAWDFMGQCEAKLDALHQLRLGSPGVPDAIHNEVRNQIAKLESPIPRLSRAGCKDR